MRTSYSLTIFVTTIYLALTSVGNAETILQAEQYCIAGKKTSCFKAANAYFEGSTGVEQDLPRAYGLLKPHCPDVSARDSYNQQSMFCMLMQKVEKELRVNGLHPNSSKRKRIEKVLSNRSECAMTNKKNVCTEAAEGTLNLFEKFNYGSIDDVEYAKAIAQKFCPDEKMSGNMACNVLRYANSLVPKESKIIANAISKYVVEHCWDSRFMLGRDRFLAGEFSDAGRLYVSQNGNECLANDGVSKFSLSVVHVTILNCGESTNNGRVCNFMIEMGCTMTNSVTEKMSWENPIKQFVSNQICGAIKRQRKATGMLLKINNGSVVAKDLRFLEGY